MIIPVHLPTGGKNEPKWFRRMILIMFTLFIVFMILFIAFMVSLFFI